MYNWILSILDFYLFFKRFFHLFIKNTGTFFLFNLVVYDNFTPFKSVNKLELDFQSESKIILNIQAGKRVFSFAPSL